MKTEDVELAFRIHNELSGLIKPVTPESIRASSVRNNLTLQAIIFAGLISFLLFIIPLMIDNFSPLVQMIGAAGLGTTLHSLYTANKFLHKSTFNPKYNQKYIITYALGLFAGSTLGFFGKEILSQNPNYVLSPNLLALVGGFSAEAVAQILQRIAETLVTLIRGSSKEKSELEAEKTITREKSKLVNSLSKTIEGDASQIKNNVQKLLNELLVD